MIANLFFSLIAAGFAAEAAAKARYERLWSFLLLGILALLGFYFWDNGQRGGVEENLSRAELERGTPA